MSRLDDGPQGRVQSDAVDQPDNPLRSILTGPDDPVEWLMPELLPRGQIALLVGPANAGKSALCYALSFAVATGLPFLGRFQPTQPARVLYFDDENAEPDRRAYLRRTFRGLAIPPEGALFDQLMANCWIQAFTLGDAQWAMTMAAAVEARAPDLIVVDTASSALALLDENSSGLAKQAFHQLRGVQQRCPGSTILLLMHERQPGLEAERPRTVRGSKYWEGAADQILLLRRKPGEAPRHRLFRTWLEPGKRRAYGLRDPIEIVPRWTDAHETGLIFEARDLAPPHRYASRRGRPSREASAGFQL